MNKTLSMRRGLGEPVVHFEDAPAPSRKVVLGEPQRLALEWLMGGGSVTDAGQYAGVCRQTVSEWLNHDEDFRKVFEEWREQVLTMNQARLVALSEAALETVVIAVRQTRDVKVSLVLLKSLGMLDGGR